jgi:hypothetical protein
MKIDLLFHTSYIEQRQHSVTIEAASTAFPNETGKHNFKCDN